MYTEILSVFFCCENPKNPNADIYELTSGKYIYYQSLGS